MEALVAIFAMLLHWRLTVSVGVAILVAVFLSSLFAGFTAGYCIALVIVGFAFGCIWQGRGDDGVPALSDQPATTVSKPVACLAYIFLGVLWGSLGTMLLRSAFGGPIVILGSVLAVGLWYRLVLHRPIATAYLVFAAVSLMAGFSLLLLPSLFRA
ncbi:MAG: hypothetical protein V4633_09215 [Pseudomonadota bacterium]